MIYKEALEVDGLESRLDTIIEEGSELIAAIARHKNRPDRNGNLTQLQTEFVQLEMCMKTVKEALDIPPQLARDEAIRFARKLDERKGYRCPCHPSNLDKEAQAVLNECCNDLFGDEHFNRVEE